MPEQAETQTVETTEPTDQERAVAQTESAENDWLDQNVSDDTPSAVHDPGDETDHEEKKTPRTGDTTGAEDADTTASDGDTATDETDEDLARALSALRRDGTPQKTIDAMLNDEDGLDELKAWGLKRAKVHADIDRKFSESKRSEVTDPSESQTGDDNASDTAASSEAQKDNLADAVEKFRDEFGDDAADVFHNFAKGLSEAAERRIAQYDRDNQITRAYMEKLMLQDARGSVAKEFPQLKDDSAYSAVEAKVRKLVKTGDYRDAETAMRDAALMVFGPELLRKAKPALEQSRRLKRGGSPTVRTHKAPAASMTQEERDDAALDLIFEGKSADEVRKALR